MKVLAIDPGYGRCGVAVVAKDGPKDMLLYSDCIETSARDAFPDRVAAVAAEIARLIERFQPPEMAIEKLYFTNNQKTAMRVAEVRGALLHLAAERDISVFEYGPGEIKSATTGSGRADKQQVMKMIRALIAIPKPIAHDDEYDAIAIGVAHLALARGRVARAQKTR